MEFDPGDTIPGRPQWRLSRRPDLSLNSEVWLAKHGKTHELRVFKFASNEGRLKGLKREVTVARFLREALGQRADFVRVLEWNLESPPYVIESEYGGLNLTEWAEQNKSLAQIPPPIRISIIADVCRAVAAAHDAGVLHKDRKPANILIKPVADGRWQVKVADFGSATLIDPARLEALGITNLGLTQTASAQSTLLTGTLMYIAPEVLSGQRAKATADIYSLGVMLYQIGTGDFRKPLAPGWEADIDDPLLREDIADAACGDPARRLKQLLNWPNDLRILITAAPNANSRPKPHADSKEPKKDVPRLAPAFPGSCWRLSSWQWPVPHFFGSARNRYRLTGFRPLPCCRSKTSARIRRLIFCASCSPTKSQRR